MLTSVLQRRDIFFLQALYHPSPIFPSPHHFPEVTKPKNHKRELLARLFWTFWTFDFLINSSYTKMHLRTFFFFFEKPHALCVGVRVDAAAQGKHSYNGGNYNTRSAPATTSNNFVGRTRKRTASLPDGTADDKTTYQASGDRFVLQT